MAFSMRSNFRQAAAPSGPPPIVRASDGRVYVQTTVARALRAAGDVVETLPATEARARAAAEAHRAPDPWGQPELYAKLSSPTVRAAPAPPAERAASASTRGPAPDAWGLRDKLQPAQPIGGHIPPPPRLEPHRLMSPRTAAATKAPNAWGVEFVDGCSRLRGGR